MADQSQAERLSAIASIQDSLRRSLFDLVSRSEQPMSRDDAAEALGMPRSTAAFHLDRLVESGLLSVEFSRRSGRTGPGAGRPAKLYRRTVSEVSVSVPERHYDLIGDVLAEAIEHADETGTSPRASLADVARARGRLLAEGSGSIDSTLIAVGYEPEPAADGTIELANCPFHLLASRHTSIVCQANLALLEGATEASETYRAEYAPEAPHCCVRLIPIAP